jgi:hypothetical protein
MTRRHYLRLAAVALWSAPVALGRPREDAMVVIVNLSNHFDALTRSKLCFLFLGKVSRWPWGAEAAPVDLGVEQSVRREFLQQVLRIDEEQLAEYWIDQRSTRGVSPPLQVRNAAGAKAWVAARPGGIAYIPSSMLDGTVKEIRIDP